MLDTHYQNSKLAEIYDLDSPWSVDRDFYLSLAGPSPISILDIGCGTGLLCDAYAARGHNVTGVDPSAAMLEVARRKPNGDKIDWVQAFAQTYQSEKQFDLIIMTGHAFQVLLEDTEVLSAFTVIRKHLKPDGQFVFESRNPAFDWASAWNYDMELNLPECAVLESRRFKSMDNDRMTFELKYQFPNEVLVSESELRFWSRKDIEERLLKCELRVDRVLGDWGGKPFDQNNSHEMIFIACAKLID